METTANTNTGGSVTTDGEVIDPSYSLTMTETKTETEEKKHPRNMPKVLVNERQYLQATDLDGRWRLASAFYKSGMVPKGYKDAAAVFAGMELACELQLRPFTALRNIAVINGSPSIWGDLPLALVRRSGHLEKIEEFWFDAEYRQICFDNRNLNVEAYGAICRTWRSGAMKETVFTMDDARRAGLLSKDNVWKTYPRRMLQMRTRSGNLKDHFGDVLLGIEITEYDYNYVPVKDVTPEGRVLRNGTVEKDIAATINETLAQTPDSDGDSSAMSLKGKGTAGRPKDSKTPSSSPVQ